MTDTAKQVWIPRVGDHIRLAEPWEFTLSMSGGRQQLSPAWIDNLREEGIAEKVQASFDADTVLKVELVSLRTNKNDYGKADSVTFSVVKAPDDESKHQGSRIWTRLNDVNEILATKLDQKEIKKLKASLKRRAATKKVAGKLYAEDVRAKVFPSKKTQNPWDVDGIVNTVGKWLIPQIIEMVPGVDTRPDAISLLRDIFSKKHSGDWRIVYRKTHTFRHPTIRSLVFNPKNQALANVFSPIRSDVNESGSYFNNTFDIWVESDPHDKKLKRVCVRFNEYVRNKNFGKRGRGSDFARDSYKKYLISEHEWSAPLASS